MFDLYRMREPETIMELKRLCVYNQLPLEKMHFYIGTDHRGSYAFGIYEREGTFVVYKNESGGTRSVYYSGSEEKIAVSMICETLLDECRMRGILPETKMWFRRKEDASEISVSGQQENRAERLNEYMDSAMPARFSPACESIADIQEYLASIRSCENGPDFLKGENAVRIDLLAQDTESCRKKKGLTLIKPQGSDSCFLFENGSILYAGKSEAAAVAWLEKCIKDREARLSADCPKDFFPSFTNVADIKKYLKNNQVRFGYAQELLTIDDRYDGKFINPHKNGQALMKRKNSDYYCVFQGEEAVYFGTDESAAVAWFELCLLKHHSVYGKLAHREPSQQEEIYAYYDDKTCRNALIAVSAVLAVFLIIFLLVNGPI